MTQIEQRNGCSSTLPEVVYTPDSYLLNPKRLFSQMIKDLAASRELAWRLFIRDISARYRQSLFGYVWAILPPIVTTLTFVFLNSRKILNIAETAIPYAAYVMLGTMLWQGFLEALNSPLRSINQSRGMLAKINFPREALVLAGLYEVLFNVAIRLVLLVGVFLWFGINVSWTLALAPLGIAVLLFLGLSLGMLLAPLGVLYGDVDRGLTIASSLWFFVTPVVYPPPTRWPYSLLVDLNPVAPVLLTTREWLTGGDAVPLGGFFLVAGVTVILLLVAWLMYRLAMPHLIERMSA